MQYAKSTKITLHSDSPMAVSSSMYGANLNTVGFNIDFIGARDVNLVTEILKLLDEARKLQSTGNK